MSVTEFVNVLLSCSMEDLLCFVLAYMISSFLLSLLMGFVSWCCWTVLGLFHKIAGK